MAAETGVVLASSAERPIHLDAIYVNQAADLICRLPMATLLLSRTGPLRQDFAGCNSLWSAIAPRARHRAIDDRKSPPATRFHSFARENASHRQWRGSLIRPAETQAARERDRA